MLQYLFFRYNKPSVNQYYLGDNMSSIEGFEKRFFSAIDLEVDKGAIQATDRDAVKGLFLRIKGSGQEAELPSLLKTLPLSARSLKILQQNLEEAHRPRMPLPGRLETLQPLALQVRELLAHDNHTVAENLFFHHDPAHEVVVTRFARSQGLLRNRIPTFEDAAHDIKTRLEEAIPLIRDFGGDRTALKDTAFLARSFSETTDEYARRWSRAEHPAKRQALFDSVSSKICLSPEAQEFYEELYSELAFMRMGHSPAAVAGRTLKRRVPEPEPSPDQETLPPQSATSPAVRQRTKSPEVRVPPLPEATPLPLVPPAPPVVIPSAKSPEERPPVPAAPQMPVQPQGEAPAPEVSERSGFNALLLPEGEVVPDLSPTSLQTIDKMTEDLHGLQRGIVRGYMKARAKEHMTEEAILALKESALRVSSGLPDVLLRYIDVLQGTLGKYAFRDDELSSIAEHLVLHFATVPALAVQIKAMMLIDSLQCLIDRPETIRGGYIQDKKDAWKKVMGVLKTHRLWQNTLEAVVERKEGATFAPLASPHPHEFPNFPTVTEALSFQRTKARWPVV
jgi:hypothetical protein